MTDAPISTDVLSLRASVLDHSSEFVELVSRAAPGEYQRLIDSGRFRQELASESVFNHGKLFAYAEFVVFRREFTERFPDASKAACINAFSSLLLKNDISITHLVDFVEGPDHREQLLLNQPGG
ncbi:MAG: hypothetical protein HKN57_12730 [Xanthomonadales bacterium]|nr:hypothetical protein [Gammaproteobacteria bacterium]MBT8054601.1 hypothetical protein [Gammaproteobacteria bacterium]NND58103.1 hypothetical protein [Xanthomonadales bacterium]NNK50376.1 hypothetical protein [Xanthomonadales bacterium]